VETKTALYCSYYYFFNVVVSVQSNRRRLDQLTVPIANVKSLVSL